MSKNVLVYGWYHKNNIGDDLFVDAFRNLFPNLNLTFVDKFTKYNVENAAAIFIGGGSFLYDDIKQETGTLDLIKTKPVFYIGVGSETQIHNTHLELMKRAKLIAIRNNDKFLNIKNNINSSIIIIPDIVYSLKNVFFKSEFKKKNKSVLVIPNITLVPNIDDPHWKFASWQYFKSEFSQFLDYLVEEKYELNFLSMCNNRKSCDSWAAIEIINNMRNKDSEYLLPIVSGSVDLARVLSNYSYIITQRFHGIILSEMMGIPCLTISHHDKLNYGNNLISYYRSNKDLLTHHFFNLKLKHNEYSFDLLQEYVNKSISSL